MPEVAALARERGAPSLDGMDAEERFALARVVERVRVEFSGLVRREEIVKAVATEAATFADARARSFIPVLVEHRVRQQLLARRRLPR